MLPTPHDKDPYMRRDTLEALEKCVQDLPAGQVPLILQQLMDEVRGVYLPAFISPHHQAASPALHHFGYVSKLFSAVVRNIVITDNTARGLADLISSAMETVAAPLLKICKSGALVRDDAVVFPSLGIYHALAEARFLQVSCVACWLGFARGS